MYHNLTYHILITAMIKIEISKKITNRWIKTDIKDVEDIKDYM